jgi:ribosome-associated protein
MSTAGPASPDRLAIAELSPWLAVRFARSSGPGGQNVNKVSTRVELLFDFENCPHLPERARIALRTRHSRRLAHDGRLRLVSQQARSQQANRSAAEARLLEIVAAALIRPRLRTPTRATRASQKRRLRVKRQRGSVKRLRRGASDVDE